VEDRDRDRPRVPAEGERDEQVVPRPEELEDRERGDRGQPEREDQPEEDAQLGRAVDPRGLEDVLRDHDEEVPEQEDRERQAERGVEEDQAEDGVEDPERVVEREDRDQRDLQRDDEQADHPDEEPVAARKLEPGERVAGERPDDDRERGAADRDVERRQQRVGDVAVREEAVVVLPGGEARVGDHLPPTGRVEPVAGHDRGQEEAERRDQPEEADGGEDQVHGRPRRDADDLGRDALARGGLGSDLGDRGHYTSLRKRRTFRASTGITSRSRKTASAEPRPKSFTQLKAVRHIASAITFASSCTDPGATERTMSKTLRTLITIVMKTTLSTGASSGTVTRRNVCHSVAPSVRAASRTSRGIAARPAAITTIANPAQTQM